MAIAFFMDAPAGRGKGYQKPIRVSEQFSHDFHKIVRQRIHWIAWFIKKEKMIKSEPGFPVFREAVSAIHWPALGWLEGDFALFSTV
jgi:hypothetical protein